MRPPIAVVYEVQVSYVDSPDSMYEHVSSMRFLAVARDVDHAIELARTAKPGCAIQSISRASYAAILGIDEHLLAMAREVDGTLSRYCKSGDHEHCYYERAAWPDAAGLGPIDCECDCHEEADDAAQE